MRVDFVRLIITQTLIVLTGAALVLMAADLSAVKSFVYGSFVAIIMAILLAWRHKQSLQVRGAEKVLQHIYKTAIERFIWVVFLLVLGFKLLEFSPLWLMAGFVMGQVAWLLAPIWMKLRTQNDK